MAGIVTKTGDQGTTGTLEGTRISKASTIIELNGTLDELNSCLGVTAAALKETADFPDRDQLVRAVEWIQNGLYNMGTEISSNFTVIRFTPEHPRRLEEELDAMTAKMPPQTKFILLSGTLPATYAHLARSVCRRSERCFVRYLQEIGHTPFPDSYQFINRLSDYLFTLARYINHQSGCEETVTQPWT